MDDPEVKRKKSSKVETYYEAGEAGGEGKIQFPDGSKYEGGMVEGKMHGEGRLEFADGNTYTGSWEKGQMHGPGHLEYKTGDEYVGEFFEGMKHGVGKFVGSNGASYEGEWQRDVITGKGSIVYPDGRRYEGDFINADKNGDGQCWYANGAHYTGQWEHNKRHGKGVLVYPSGARYDGEWKEGKYQGQGSYFYPCGDTYTGDFSDDKKHGNGIYTWGDDEPDEDVPASIYGQNTSSKTNGDSELSEEAAVSAGVQPIQLSEDAMATPMKVNTHTSVNNSPIDSERQRLFKKAELIRNNRAKALEAQASQSNKKSELFHHAAEVVGEATTLDNASFDDLLVAEHNFVRTQPAKYAETRVRPVLARITAAKTIQFNSGLKIDSKEGAAAVNTLLLDLTKRSPCAPLELDYALSRAASEHCRDLCSRGIFNTEEHKGFDGSDLTTRIQRHGSVLHAAENIANTHNHHVDIVLALLIDDGLPSRGHRKNILDPKFTTIGCSPCTPSTGKYLTVFNYATGFTKLEEQDFEEEDN